MNRAIRFPSINQSTGLLLGIVFSLGITGLIWAIGDRLVSFELRPDRNVAFWYPWVSANPSFWTHASVWAGYVAHQLTIWGLIFYAQRRKTKYSSTLGIVNVLALLANAAFVLLHLAQTHLFYDGLAVDVSEQSSQWSVILLLVIVLLMENQRRGLFAGYRVKASFLSKSARGLRKYHGYYFAWAIIYTFWYHPMVSTPGHLIGFLYIFLLLLQSSLFFTPLHVNKWWTFTLEIGVLFHGSLVAYTQSPNAWPMFFFGFAGIFVVTQMHGLGLSKLTRCLLLAAYIGGALLVYSEKGLHRLQQVAWIPITEYLVVFVVAGLVWGAMTLFALLQRARRT